MPWKIIWLEVYHNRKFAFLFLLNLVVGLVGFISLDGFKNSFSLQLQDASRDLLTADLSVGARRSFSDSEKDTIKKIVGYSAELSTTRTLYSMAASPSRTALVELVAIDDNHPLVGAIRLGDDTIVGSGRAHDLNQAEEDPTIWVVPEILTQFKRELGDTLRLGTLDFRIAQTIADDSGMSIANAGFAPRIYMGRSFLAKTGLLQKGTTSRQAINILLPQQRRDEVALLSKALSQKFDNTVRVTNYLRAGQDNGRLLSYLTDYLGLVSLVALFLSGIGAFYLFRSYMAQKEKDIAVLLSLGLSGRRATIIYMFQLVLLGSVAAIAASLLSLVLLPQLVKLLAQFAPIELQLTLGYRTLLSALLLGSLTPLLLCLPLLLSISDIKPSLLFQEFSSFSLQLRLKNILGFIPIAVGTYGLAVWQANSYLVGSLFFAGLIAACLAVGGIGLMLLWLLEKIKSSSLGFRFAQSYLTRHKISSISCFLALALSTVLINLIPQIESTLLKEIARPEGEALPSLFVFDIQAEQEERLKEMLKEEGLELSYLAPMVRGRLTGVNGETLDKVGPEQVFSREEERSRRMRNREANISYSLKLNPSEEIISGKAFSGSYTGDFTEPGELSLEQRYASRLGIEIGDKLSFEIQGLPIEGRVVNLRRVKWNSFQPNFFIKFQDGVINDAPKTFLGVVPPVDYETKIRLQNTIVSEFPNISIIDVSKVVGKLAEVIAQMSQILKVMAWLSVLSGLVVTFSIANHKAQSRLWDVNLLKVLGTSFGTVRMMIFSEFFLLSAAAALFGVIVSVGASFGLGTVLFGGLWEFDGTSALLTTVLIIALCLGVSQLASRRVLASKAQLYL